MFFNPKRQIFAAGGNCKIAVWLSLAHGISIQPGYAKTRNGSMSMWDGLAP